MYIQDFLKTGIEMPLEVLQASFGIYTKRHPKYPNLIQFAYDMLETSSAELKVHPIVRECRGLILDEAKDWAVVARPFDRFFNVDEPTADVINWNNAIVQEKVDGSLMIVYYYDEQWNVATRGSPDAGGNVGVSDRVFNEYFWKTIEKLGLNFYFNWTYMFEFTSPENRVVCDHKEPSVTLIGVRHNETGVERCMSEFRYDVNTVKQFPISNLEDCLAACKELDPIKQEGFVVVDCTTNHFKRVKIKSPSYVALHHLKNGFGDRRIIELIKNGQESEVLSYFDDFREKFREIQSRLDTLILNAETEYEKIRHLPIGKDFALEAMKNPMSGALFAVHRGKEKSIREAVMAMSVQYLENLL